MERKEFIRSCGFACFGVSAFSAFLQSCSPAKQMSGSIKGDELVVDLVDFETVAGGEVHYKNYIIVNNPQLKYPICVYRLGDGNYSAVLMKCTHQGAELQVFGDKLQCPAHGSVFDNTGMVINSPANLPLRVFPVIIDKSYLKISLKAI